MLTKKIYLESFDLNCRARVTGMRENGLIVTLDQTVFHPQGGGQRSDAGMIGDVVVCDVRHNGEGGVNHFLQDPLPADIGDLVDLKVDGATRQLHARYHSGGHLVADALSSIWSTLKAVQGHHWPGEARVEFEGQIEDDNELKWALSERIERLVLDDLPIKTVGDPHSNRTIQIGDFPAIGCGGTHVLSTADILGLEVVKTKRKNGRLRVSYGFANYVECSSNHY